MSSKDVLFLNGSLTVALLTVRFFLDFELSTEVDTEKDSNTINAGMVFEMDKK